MQPLSRETLSLTYTRFDLPSDTAIPANQNYMVNFNATAIGRLAQLYLIVWQLAR
jgi:hypothetical protein